MTPKDIGLSLWKREHIRLVANIILAISLIASAIIIIRSF